jgi:hypothetical protein
VLVLLLVGGGTHLKLGMGVRTGVLVGVPFHGQAAVGCPHFLAIRLVGEPQQRITAVVHRYLGVLLLGRHDGQTTPSSSFSTSFKLLLLLLLLVVVSPPSFSSKGPAHPSVKI